jgi:hypothetical protein
MSRAAELDVMLARYARAMTGQTLVWPFYRRGGHRQDQASARGARSLGAGQRRSRSDWTRAGQDLGEQRLLRRPGTGAELGDQMA